MKNKSFRFLWMSQSAANLGDIFYIVGLISILYALTDSAFVLALVPFLNMFGRFLSGFISPLLINRFPLKTLLVYSQVGKTILLFLLALLIIFQTSTNTLGILNFVFFIAFLDGWAAPASQAMFPRLVAKDELVKANGFFSVVFETVNLGGWALGGLLVAVLSGRNVILVTLGLYLISTIMTTLIIDLTPFHRKESEDRKMDELKEGWQMIWQNPLYKSIHVIIAVEAIANVVWIASILYLFVTDVLGETEALWGTINTVFFLGMVISGIICTRFASTVEKHFKYVFITASFGISLITLLFGFTKMAWLSLVFVGLSGIFQQLKGITIDTMLQKAASSEELPKMYAVQNAIIALLFAGASLLFGALAEIWDVRIVFILAAALLCIAAIYTFVKRRQFSI